jgi:DNA-binding response OmpR family regulator
MRRVLLVEDEANQRLLFQEALEDEGYLVDTAGDGVEALERFAEARPDVVVLDLMMPRMDGIELLSTMLAEDSSIPVVIHTAYSGYRDNFMTWSADAYVVKSSDLTELKARVGEVLAGREPQHS